MTDRLHYTFQNCFLTSQNIKNTYNILLLLNNKNLWNERHTHNVYPPLGFHALWFYCLYLQRM